MEEGKLPPQFRASIPEKHLLSGYSLQSRGWKRDGKSYIKGDDVIEYDGVYWTLNGKKRVEFIEDLNQD